MICPASNRPVYTGEWKKHIPKPGEIWQWMETRRFFKLLNDYYLSPEWRERSTNCLIAADYKCMYCGGHATMCHHVRGYANVFRETPEDLGAICVPCHRKLHPNRPGLGKFWYALEPPAPTQTPQVTEFGIEFDEYDPVLMEWVGGRDSSYYYREELLKCPSG